MARALNPTDRIMRAAIVVVFVILAGCSGEPVPRDYQNAPPTVTSPPDTKLETPAQYGVGDPPPQPSSGVEGTSAPYEPAAAPVEPTTTTIPDTPPTTTS